MVHFLDALYFILVHSIIVYFPDRELPVITVRVKRACKDSGNRAKDYRLIFNRK